MALTVLRARDLCQDAEGAGLRGSGAWAPVLRVLDQTLFAGVAQVRAMVHHRLRICDGLPGNSDKTKKSAACRSLMNRDTLKTYDRLLRYRKN